MNKQQRYISLLLLASVVSGARAMDLVQAAAPQMDAAAPQEEKPDKYKLLQPKLSDDRKAELRGTINWIVDEKSKNEMVGVYNAAQELELDEQVDKRDKETRATRKEAWGKVKAAYSSREEAAKAVNYMTGSEDEEETADEGVKLNKLVARVHRRDGHLAKQTAQLQSLARAEGTVKAEQEKRAAQLSALLAARQPLDAENETLATQESELTQKQNKIGATQEAMARLVGHAVEYAQEDELLKDATREQLVPVLAGELVTEKEKLARELARVLVAKQLLAGKLTPLASQIEQTEKEQQENSIKQTELAQLIAQAPKAQSLAKEDRDKLLLTLDQRIELATAEREKCRSEVKDLVRQVAAEQDATAKTELQKQKTAKDAETAQVIQNLSNLLVARAQADKTYGTTKWAVGYYSGK